MAVICHVRACALIECPLLSVQANLPHFEGKVYNSPKGAIEDSLSWSKVPMTVHIHFPRALLHISDRITITPFQQYCQFIVPCAWVDRDSTSRTVC